MGEGKLESVLAVGAGSQAAGTQGDDLHVRILADLCGSSLHGCEGF